MKLNLMKTLVAVVAIGAATLTVPGGAKPAAADSVRWDFNIHIGDSDRGRRDCDDRGRYDRDRWERERWERERRERERERWERERCERERRERWERERCNDRGRGYGWGRGNGHAYGRRW